MNPVALWIGIGLLLGDVQWSGVSHLSYEDRRPICPVNGQSFDVLLQTYRLDVTGVRVHVDDGGEQWVSAVYQNDSGPYAVWRATIPATGATVLRYYFEITDEDDVDYYSVSGMSDNPPGDGGFVIDRLTLSHAPVGATLVSGGTLFKVWAPNAASAWVRGQFNGWGTGNPMTNTGDYFITIVPGAADRQQYKYYFDPGAIWKSDARARSMNAGDNYNSHIENPLRYSWSSNSWATPPFEDMIIYELHVGTFAGKNDPVGAAAYPSRFRDIGDRAAHFADLGVNMVELMPPFEFPTDQSLGYNPISAWAPEWRYGTPDDFKYMVDALHAHGVGVLLDIVWNHFSPSDNYLWTYDSASQQIYFRVPDQQTPWGSQADFGRVEVREYFLESAAMWLDEFRVDGFRMDATDFMNIGANEADGWLLMQRLNDLMDNRAVHKINIAEQLPNDPWVTRPTALGGAGFDAQWHDAFNDALQAAVFSAAFGNPDMGWLASAINGGGEYQSGRYLMRYFQLHDEASPGSGGQRAVKTIDTTFPHDDYWAKARLRLALGVTMFTPGIPAILMGDEWLEYADVAANFNNRIDWALKTTHAAHYQFVKDIISLRQSNGSMRADAGWQVSHVNDGGNVIGWQRYDNSGNVCFVVANFANVDYTNYRIGLPQAGTWNEILNSQAAAYEGNNVGNLGSTATEPIAWDGHPQSALITIPQAGLLVLRRGSPPPPPCPGDVDGDRDVDLTDLSRLLAHFGIGGGMTRGDGDLDGDGDVDLTDLSLLLANFGSVCE